MTETWKAIEGYEGLYEVSSEGRVKSLERLTPKRQRISTKILKPLSASNGYTQVCLWREGKPYRSLVHRLVARAFLGPCPVGYVVCHGPQGKLVNAVQNLSYGTLSKNSGEDKERDGTLVRGERHYRAVLTEACVKRAKTLKDEGFTYDQIERQLGVKKRTLRAALTGENWKHIQN